MHYGHIDKNIAKGLIKLRKRIDKAGIPSSMLDESLNIATWNIREFGAKKRLKASIYYIAEIINQFDLVALVELRNNLGDLRRVMKVLGSDWDVVFSDFIDDDAGNKERVAFLYDTRMVRFTGLAAEADAPRFPRTMPVGARQWDSRNGWWRAPYMASFEAGSFDFVVIAAHIRWGDGVRDRVPPLRALGDWVARRAAHPFATDSDFIVMGDFNIPTRRSSAYKALTHDGKGLKIPAALMGVKGTNLSKRNSYDQILHNATDGKRFANAGGALDFYCDDWKPLYPDPRHSPSSKSKFTFELSDHLPLWLQIRTDIVDQHLQKLAGV
jgi:endonuclease/exonuclease/phosphatase family metal-dependent hydrolase